MCVQAPRQNYICINGDKTPYIQTHHAQCIRLLAGRCMNICAEEWSLSTVMEPHSVYNKHKELLQSYYWKLKENQTFSADHTKWTSIFEPVTQHLRGHWICNEKNQEPNFCHDNCKTLSKLIKGREGSAGLYHKIITLQWYNCVSVCVVVIVIQIMSMTLLEQSSLAFSLSYMLFYLTIRSSISLWSICSRTLKS